MVNTFVKAALLLLLTAAPLASSAPAAEALALPDVPDAAHPHPHSHTVHPHKHTHKHSHKKPTQTKSVKHTTTTGKRALTTSSSMRKETTTSTSTLKKHKTTSTSTAKKHMTTSTSTSTPKKHMTTSTSAPKKKHTTTSTPKKHSTTSSSSSTTTSSSSSTTSTSSTSSSSSSSTSSSTTPISSTTSSSTTIQATASASALPDSSCGNSGLAFAFFHNPFGLNRDTSYSQFNPSYFKTVSPLVVGAGHYVGGYSGQCAAPYEVSVFGHTESCNNFTTQYKGYMYAAKSGTYTFTLAAVDDIGLLWLGPTAYSGYSRSNAVLDLTFFGPVKTQTYSYTAQAGQYVPMRVMNGNGNGPYGYNLTAAAPDGTIIFSRTVNNSPYLVEYSCNGVAPRFPYYGQET